MHTMLRKLLEDAYGMSEFVIAVNLDIRGFSTFSQKVESPDSAMFIKRVYIKLIDKYFVDASFFKPTGDGLLLTIPYTEKNLQNVARNTIDVCLRVLREFGTFCENDPMINFEVPKRIGIGLSRGTVCRIISKSKTLDYSGRVLNLASRLMDFARPTGIVFDDDFSIELLSDEQIKLFLKDSIFIKGIAERDPIVIWYTKDLTTISSLSKKPIDKVDWQVDAYPWTLGRIKNHSAKFSYTLQTEPVDSREIKVQITYPSILRQKRQKGFETFYDFNNFEYALQAGKPHITIQFDALAKQLEAKGVKSPWPVKIEIIYPRRSLK